MIVLLISVIGLVIRNQFSPTNHLLIIKIAFKLTSLITFICVISECVALTVNDNLVIQLLPKNILLIISLIFLSFYLLLSLISIPSAINAKKTLP